MSDTPDCFERAQELAVLLGLSTKDGVPDVDGARRMWLWIAREMRLTGMADVDELRAELQRHNDYIRSVLMALPAHLTGGGQ